MNTPTQTPVSPGGRGPMCLTFSDDYPPVWPHPDTGVRTAWTAAALIDAGYEVRWWDDARCHVVDLASRKPWTEPDSDNGDDVVIEPPDPGAGL